MIYYYTATARTKLVANSAHVDPLRSSGLAAMSVSCGVPEENSIVLGILTSSSTSGAGPVARTGVETS